jgi:RNA polymerase sigma-70 factor (ECF subfamily)
LVEKQLYNEKIVLGEIASGSESAFNLLFDKYRLPVYAHTLSIIKSPARAEEITQDIFIQLWNKRADLTSITSFNDWLFILTRNRSLSELRKKVLSHTGEPDEHLASGDDPLSSLLFKEKNELLKKAIDRLPPRRKQVFILSRVENKTHKEIAEIMGISPGTVNIQLVQALASLRTYLHEMEQKDKNFPGEYMYLLIAASLSLWTAKNG